MGSNPPGGTTEKSFQAPLGGGLGLFVVMGMLVIILGAISVLFFNRAYDWSLANYEHNGVFSKIVFYLEDRK